MLVSFVVHLTASELTRGALVGRVTDVESGVVSGFRNAEELFALLLAAGLEWVCVQRVDDASHNLGR